jgi:hypothetical protein
LEGQAHGQVSPTGSDGRRVLVVGAAAGPAVAQTAAVARAAVVDAPVNYEVKCAIPMNLRDPASIDKATLGTRHALPLARGSVLQGIAP